MKPLPKTSIRILKINPKTLLSILESQLHALSLINDDEYLFDLNPINFELEIKKYKGVSLKLNGT